MNRSRCRCGQRRPTGLAFENGGDGVRHGLGGKRRPGREHLVQDAGERPDVGTLVDRLAARLFGAHVGRRAHHDALARSLDRDRLAPAVSGAAVTGTDDSREPEVQHLDNAVRRDLDVRRFEIPVNDPLLVRRPRAPARSAAQCSACRRSVGSVRDTVVQRVALYQLKHQRPHTVRILRSVNRADVWDDSATRARAPRVRTASADPGRS